jgi:hypothetical protein
MRRYYLLGMVAVFNTVLATPVVSAPVVSAPVVSAPAVKHQAHPTTIAIPKGQAIPTIKLVVTPDAMKGWNMNIQTENFAFAPEQASQSSKTTEGHAQFFLNGKKLARLYGPWAHIPSLPKGKNELKVSLNTNMHEDLTHEGKVIEATTIVEVP